MTFEKEIKTILSGTWLADEIEPSEIAEMIINGDNIDTITEYIQERINEIEIVYYNNAMEILSREDNSLRTSLGLAHDMCFELQNLNSEILATLLVRDSCNGELGGVISEIQELMDSL